MKNLFFKSLTAIFLIVALCSLTACGGGGGGGSSSSGNSGSGDNGNSIINNQTLQATAVSNIISRLRNNISHLFRSSSIRSNINNSYRAAAFPSDLWEKNVETNTGKVLLNIAKIEIPETDYDVEKVLDTSLDSFKKRFSNDIIYSDSKMVVAKSGEYNIGLSIDKDGDTQMKTYFVTYGTQSDDVIGVSFLKNHDYATFPFRMETSQGELCIVGYIYIGAQMYRGFQAGGSSETLAYIFGTGTKEFDYENYKTHESTTYDYSGNALIDDTDSEDYSYLEKFPETVAIRYAIKPIRENASKISGFVPKSSARATVNITEDLNNYDTLNKVKTFIGCETIADFNKLTGAQQILTNQKVSDSFVSNGIINMSVAQKDKLTIGLVIETADVTMKVNGKQQTFKDNTQIWFVVDPTSKAIAAFAYSDTGDANSSGTYIFRISSDGTELEGKSFWNGQKSYFPDVTYKGNDSNRNSFFTGNAEQLVYTLYNSQNRTKIEEGCPITIKYDGTWVK